MTVSTARKEQRVTIFTKAEEAYTSAAKTTDLWMGQPDEGIRLFRGQVIDNDAPGSGRSDQEDIEPFVEVSGQTVFRKTLQLDDPAVLGTQLAFIAKERQDNQSTLQFTINGHPVLRPPSRQAAPQANQYWELLVGQWSWSRWYYVDIPPETLRLGENVIEVAAVEGLAGWQLMVADYRDFYKGMDDPVTLPYASRHSVDGGQTWEEERGEYVLRLALDRFRSNGELVSKVIDAAGEPEDAVKSERSLQRITLDWDADIPAGTRLNWALRTGSRLGSRPLERLAGLWRTTGNSQRPLSPVESRFFSRRQVAIPGAQKRPDQRRLPARGAVYRPFGQHQERPNSKAVYPHAV